MKKELLFLIFFFSILCIDTLYSQCSVDTYIEDNFLVDAKILAVREIVSDPLDPDYDNPFPPVSRYASYLEKFSAIYNNPNNDPVLDSLFNEFEFHANTEYIYPVSIKFITFKVDNNISWINDFKTTGISGNTLLDNLVSDFQLSIHNILELSQSHYFTLITGYDALNMQALVDDFDMVNDISNVFVAPEFNDRFNYTGIPYNLYDNAYNEPLEVVDIIVTGDLIEFWMGAGDCMAGCMMAKSYFVEVDANCNATLLSTPEFYSTGVTLYPNPAKDYIHIEGLKQPVEHISVYTISGKALPALIENNKIDISNLAKGVYIVSITTSEGQKTYRKFIKR